MTNQAEFDSLQRFLFNQADVRGELVRLQKSYAEVVSKKAYPEPIKTLLGEMLAATSLLTATLKFEGEIALQLQGEGALKYAVINGTHEQKMRGIARWDESLSDFPSTFDDMIEKGVMVITITPKEGERYQGMVGLDKSSLAECLEGYFEQSEQLATKLLLNVDCNAEQPKSTGLLLQILPKASEVVEMSQREDFEHLTKLAETLTAKEMFELSSQDLLYRLFHQEEVELFQAETVVFSCTCSRERSAAALTNVGKEELLDIIAKDGDIKMNCQYCNAEYIFDAVDVEAIHAGSFAVASAHSTQ